MGYVLVSITKYYKLSDLKQPWFLFIFSGLKRILSQFEKLEVQNQGVVRALLPLKTLESILSSLSQFLATPWCVAT